VKADLGKFGQVTSMFCSTIIPTVGRSSLTRAVESVLQQELDSAEFEIIVVNDSGVTLPAADWQRSERVRLLTTNRRERSVARNTGAAIARGRYLHFLDDDDWLEPGALQHLWDLANRSSAPWLYGSSQTYDRQGQPLIQLHHRLKGNCFLPAMAGEWIPFQASLVEASVFFSSGGFNPLMTAAEDIDLLRRMTLHHEVAGSDAIVANILLGENGSTTNQERHRALRRWAREEVLNESGVFARFEESLGQLPPNELSWHGQIVRVYLTSMIWNLRRRRFWCAVSRATFVLAAAIYASSSLFSRTFWQALTRPYPNPTFARGAAVAVAANSLQPAQELGEASVNK
jgi:glycosyltransferase involved in cell wall biosynthesis